LWGGFVVETPGRTFYFVGDTGYSPQFREIGARFRSLDLSLIPIGAYEPRWFMQPMHVNPEEAVQIHRDIGSRRSIAMHYGKFHLTDEGIDEPIQRLASACAAAGVPADAFSAIDFGATLSV
jgi:N-acyl-phosphatidylethanolamine-hydrolysing phospholipase D